MSDQHGSHPLLVQRSPPDQCFLTPLSLSPKPRLLPSSCPWCFNPSHGNNCAYKNKRKRCFDIANHPVPQEKKKKKKKVSAETPRPELSPGQRQATLSKGKICTSPWSCIPASPDRTVQGSSPSSYSRFPLCDCPMPNRLEHLSMAMGWWGQSSVIKVLLISGVNKALSLP